MTEFFNNKLTNNNGIFKTKMIEGKSKKIVFPTYNRRNKIVWYSIIFTLIADVPKITFMVSHTINDKDGNSKECYHHLSDRAVLCSPEETLENFNKIINDFIYGDYDQE